MVPMVQSSLATREWLCSKHARFLGFIWRNPLIILVSYIQLISSPAHNDKNKRLPTSSGSFGYLPLLGVSPPCQSLVFPKVMDEEDGLGAEKTDSERSMCAWTDGFMFCIFFSSDFFEPHRRVIVALVPHDRCFFCWAVLG